MCRTEKKVLDNLYHSGHGIDEARTEVKESLGRRIRIARRSGSLTIIKSRETWPDQEHDKFIEALHLFDRDWMKIRAFVGSKTVIQAE
ncbi:hypothetical protein ACET3Z_021588 [Daucus carota]